MWKVLESRRAAKQLDKAPRQVVEKYEFWRLVVEHDGPAQLKQLKGMHDEALLGKHKGKRSSRLNRQWRVLYRVVTDAVEVHVLEVNPHDY